MTLAVQTSLFDPVGDDMPAVCALGANVIRRKLTMGAWVDVRPGFIIDTAIFADLQSGVDWRAERRQMYQRVVDVPRLVRFYGEDDRVPNSVVMQAKRILDEHYETELGERFATIGMCHYRDGSDSVAWHGDNIGRSATEDTMVAIVSLGSTRTLMLRPRGGGHSLKFSLGHGDLIVMGGSCQRTWEHCIPKVASSIGPRISVQFRPRGVR